MTFLVLDDRQHISRKNSADHRYEPTRSVAAYAAVPRKISPLRDCRGYRRRCSLWFLNACCSKEHRRPINEHPVVGENDTCPGVTLVNEGRDTQHS